MQQPVVKATKLGCRYGNHYVLQDINWEISAGEHWLVFGLNGSGKTTLVTTLAGFGYYSEGTLEVFGTPYTEENILHKRRHIGLVSSSFFDRCYQQESVWDIVLSGVTGSLMPNFTVLDEDRKRAIALLEALGIDHKRYLPFSRLSKGQRQNVLIARALVSNPKLLIMDEPATGLDVLNRELLLSTVRELARNTKMTMIYITHYTEEILEEFDRCLLLKNGRIYRQGQTADLFQSKPFQQFLDYPASIGRDSNRLHVSLSVTSSIPTLLAAPTNLTQRSDGL